MAGNDRPRRAGVRHIKTRVQRGGPQLHGSNGREEKGHRERFSPFIFKRKRGTKVQGPLALKVTDSYFYQTSTALYPVKSENSPTTADDR